MICFADSREFVTRWQMNLNENESNSHFQRIRPEQFREKASGGAIQFPTHTGLIGLAQQCDIGEDMQVMQKRRKILRKYYFMQRRIATILH